MRFVLIALTLCFGLSACNTVQGAGRDLESLGKAGEEAIKSE